MTLGILLLVVIFFLYKLFISGLLFRIILFVFGWIGIWFVLSHYVDGAKDIVIRFGSNQDYGMSWAALVPTIICLLCLASTKE